MNLFAIDLGNKKIKMKSNRAEYSYPASYLTTDFLSPDSFSAHQHIHENQVYRLGEGYGPGFVWGEALEIYNLPEKMIDTYARSKRMKQKKTQRILEFALGRLALDYKGEYSEDAPLVVHVMLGAPITDMHKESGTLELLKNHLIGQHYLQVNGEDIWLEIPSEEYISIIPQYMGTLLNLAFDEVLSPVEAYIEGRLGIVDIGGGTILVNSANALNLSPGGMEKFYGTQTLIKDISSSINSTKPFLIEKMLQDGSSSKSYFYRTNRSIKGTRDVTENVKAAIDRYTRFTVAPLITENFPDIEDFDCIVVTGGGSTLLSKEALLDEIGEEYFEALVFVEEPERANVRGFYKGGLIKWQEEILQDNQVVSQIIQERWGTSPVEFDSETGVLSIYSGELSTESFPPSIERSAVKEIHFVEPVTFPTNSMALFGTLHYKSLEGAMENLTTLKGMVNVSTRDVSNMSFMFNGCRKLEVIDLSSFNTSQVLNMSNIFANCQTLRTLDLTSFDTSRVQNFDSMFLGCLQLEHLELQDFDMRNAVSQVDMFEGCVALQENPLESIYK